MPDLAHLDTAFDEAAPRGLAVPHDEKADCEAFSEPFLTTRETDAVSAAAQFE
jgi:hypothetical protein